MAFPHDGNKWKPGESGNPKGYPIGVPNRSTVFKRWASLVSKSNNELTGLKEDLTEEDLVVIKLFVEAKNGNVIAAREVLDSLYGKATEKIESNHTFTTNPDEFIDSYLNK